MNKSNSRANSAATGLLLTLRREKLRRVFRGAERFAFGFYLGGFFLAVAGDTDRRRNALAGDGAQREGGEKGVEIFHDG